MTDLPGADEQVVALIDLIGRTGAQDFRIQYDDTHQPVVWNALSRHGAIWSVGAGLTPKEATFSLAESLMDGGTCVHCQKPTGVVLDLGTLPPFICWYHYDAETATMRRGCE